MSLTVQTARRGDLAVVSVAGELDMATAPQLEEEIAALLARGESRLVLDLAEVSFCDSTGLSVFVRTRNRCQDAGGRLRIAAAPRAVRRVLEVSGLIDVLEVCPTVDAAVAADRPAFE